MILKMMTKLDFVISDVETEWYRVIRNNTNKIGRPRLPTEKKKVAHRRNTWREASQKYYAKNRDRILSNRKKVP